jgi:hypothetical protein
MTNLKLLSYHARLISLQIMSLEIRLWLHKTKSVHKWRKGKNNQFYFHTLTLIRSYRMKVMSLSQSRECVLPLFWRSFYSETFASRFNKKDLSSLKARSSFTRTSLMVPSLITSIVDATTTRSTSSTAKER